MNRRKMALIIEADSIRIIWVLSWVSFLADSVPSFVCLPIHLWKGDNYNCSSFASEGCYRDSFKKFIKLFEHGKVKSQENMFVIAVVLANLN